MLKDKEYKIYVNGVGYGVSKELYEYYHQSERRISYAEKDRKCERIHVDVVNNKIIITPSIEDSFERLQENGEQFIDNYEETIDTITKKVLIEQALMSLSDKERDLIYQLYFLEKSEREVANDIGVYHNAIHKKKLVILEKLRKYIMD